MAARGSLGDPGRILDALLSRPRYRSGSSSYRSHRDADDDGSWSFKPNAPRMVTVLAAVALTVLGLSQTLVTIPFLDDLIAGFDLRLTAGQLRDYAYLALIGSPLLIIAGSFMRGL